MNKILIFWSSLAIFTSVIISCKKFLDDKPDQKLTTPTSLRDLQLILDNEGVFNDNYPSAGEIASDNYYLNSVDLGNIAVVLRDNYLWEPLFDFPLNWQYPYQKVFHANVVLDNLDKVDHRDNLQYNSIKGSALFFRAFAFFKIAQIYTLPYDINLSSQQLGIPLVTSSDINTVNNRATLKQTYSKIVSDLEESVKLLPRQSSVPTRPNRAAAFSLLSYTYLIMHDFENANKCADSSLAIANELMNYNLITTPDNPFQRFNKEVLFQARIFAAPPLAPARCKVDSMLYNSYSSDDLRKTLFFKSNNNGTYAFKGSYDANPTGSNLFCGITVDETYLLKAESSARLGRTNDAMLWINNLLRTRWKQGTFVDFTAANSEQALDFILSERRKELVFRGGIRWTDLRRLNYELNRKSTLKRIADGNEYFLLPNDPRYAFLIPISIIALSGIEQNGR